MASAIQPDAPFLEDQKRNAAEWKAEDNQIDTKLAALEKRFGKKPRGEFYPGLLAVTPLQNLLKSHMQLIRRFPHRVSETMPRGAEIIRHD